MSIVSEFLSRVQAVHQTGAATEHSYRPALEALFNALAEGVAALNEPKRVACGAPDFIIQRGDITVGHAEAKDLGLGLRAMKDANQNQQDRYRAALPNLIYTNCLDWDFYRDGKLFAAVTIADFLMGIQPRPDDYARLENLLRDFIAQRPQTITQPRDLAERMAGKAVLIKDVLHNALRLDTDLQTDLAAQFKAFREHLIHDITPDDFADIYAETIAYGMFAARLHDTTLNDFSRQEALELLPKSNPFLRALFGYIAGPDLDDRIAWVIDDLAKVFQAANVKQIMAGFGKLTGQSDPFLHFYETFLAAYNPAKRKARGVWYTPEPVVNFIVRAVDEVLQTEFGLADGLADTSKVMIDWDTGEPRDAKAVTERREVHRVQILDPAIGTGTFLAEVIKQIAPRVKNVAEGMWPHYIERDLIPRLHGFELLMASYAMCHMKLDMILTELGYKPTGAPPRLGVYLTNSLEEGEREVRDLFMAQWLTREAREANTIKRQTPIMCVIGNPPYSGVSSNNGEWATNLIAPYKKEPGGKVKLKERNPKWINDDYVKFIRYAEYLIEKTGEGVLGFITNHGYLDNPTFRGMRWHLLDTFDKIYVLDLHGNAKKKEVTPEGKPDKNVFDIQQGVAIIIGVKKKAGKGKKALANILHAELLGDRAGKYQALWEGKLDRSLFQNVSPESPQFLFVNRNYDLTKIYDTGFPVQEIFPVGVMGFQTHRDHFAVSWNRDEILERGAALRDQSSTDQEIANRFDVSSNRDWNITAARTQIQNDDGWQDKIASCQYRPLDSRPCYLSEVMMDYPRSELVQNSRNRDNLLIGIGRQGLAVGPIEWCLVTASSFAMDANLFRRGGLRVSPLYLYPSEQYVDQTRRVNFDPKLYQRLQALATHPTFGTPDEVAVFDYIYGTLHCPAYRASYAEFLKIDFPRIPWPASPAEFWDISAKGSQLRKLHLMDPATIGPTPYPFKGQGDAVVAKPRFEGGPDGNKVWINPSQKAYPFHSGKDDMLCPSHRRSWCSVPL